MFKQPMAIHSAGTRSRASSLSRDSGTSQYLSSLESKPAFDKEVSRMSRQMSQPRGSGRSPRQGNSDSTPSFGSAVRSPRSSSVTNLNSFDFSPRRTEEREIVFKKDYGPRGEEIVRREETRYLSGPETSRPSRGATTTAANPMGKPPLSLRHRRSSVGNPDDSSSTKLIENLRNQTSSGFGKYSSTQVNFGMKNEFDEPMYRTAHNFRQARRQQESDELSQRIKNTVDNLKSRRSQDATIGFDRSSRFIRSGSLDVFENDGFQSRSQRSSWGKRAF